MLTIIGISLLAGLILAVFIAVSAMRPAKKYQMIDNIVFRK